MRGCRAWVLVSSVLLLAACGTASPGDPSGTATAGTSGTSSAAAPGLAGTSWALRAVAGAGTLRDYTESPLGAELSFAEGGAVSGSTGCNTFTGTYAETASSLTITLGATTKMACTTAAAADQERYILAALPQVASYVRTGDLLDLIGTRGGVLLRYSEAAGLPGTAWRATGVNDGDGGVVSSDATSSVTAVFGLDGVLSGSSGCNTYSARYELTGAGAIAIGDLTSTEKACEDAAMMLEADYVAALGRATAYELTASSLTLRDASGAIQATFRRAIG